MTTHEQLERKIAELYEKMFALKKKIESVEAKIVSAEKNKFPYEYGKTYYYITDIGCILPITLNCSDRHKNLLQLGNIFNTREEAKFYIERLKVLAEMRKYAFEPDWNNDSQEKWGISYYPNGLFNIDTYSYSIGQPVFKDRETAFSCISAIGEERLKKYYFGVKDVG